MAVQRTNVTPYSIEWVGCHTHRIPERYRGGGWGWWCERGQGEPEQWTAKGCADLDLPGEALTTRQWVGCGPTVHRYVGGTALDVGSEGAPVDLVDGAGDVRGLL